MHGTMNIKCIVYCSPWDIFVHYWWASGGPGRLGVPDCLVGWLGVTAVRCYGRVFSLSLSDGRCRYIVVEEGFLCGAGM